MASGDDIIISAVELKLLEDLVRTTGDKGPYGLTEAGFVPKPYLQLLREGFAAASAVMGADVDLAPGSALRKILEVNAVELARTHALLAGVVDDLTVAGARGPALSRRGEELGVPRPFMRASGSVRLALTENVASLVIPRGTRLTSAAGNRHAFLLADVELGASGKTATAQVAAFFPGVTGNLDPTAADQKLALWNDGYDPAEPGGDKLAALRAAAVAANKKLEEVVTIAHTTALTGGEQRWPDESYRELLLRLPRSVWTPEAIQAAVSLVPGVRQAIVRDQDGGLDIEQSIFGDFNFLERLFAAERDLFGKASFSVLVAPEDGAIWGGPGNLLEQVLEAIEELRPIGVLPDVRPAIRTGFKVRAKVSVRGLPLPSGSHAVVNQSPPAMAFKQRLVERMNSYVSALAIHETVRASKLEYQLMSDPNVVDVQNLEILQSGTAIQGSEPVSLGEGVNLRVPADSMASLLDSADTLQLEPTP
ncbi:MAG: hypothetical protein JSS07_12320 [Proteobacteria bacterium]|nr:hypothetical protein [Pseudomonadota bacterium]